MIVEFLRGRRDRRYALSINDPQPLKSIEGIWGSAAQMATVGIFVLLVVACLYFSRAIVLPIMAALLVGTTLGPAIKRASDYGLPPWASAIVLVGLLAGIAGIVVTMLAAPVVEWINRAPEIGASVKQKLYVLDRPLAALRDLQNVLMPSAGTSISVESSQISMVTPVLAFVTPAVAQVVLFFATLIFFLAGQMELRRQLASRFASQDGKLRFTRIAGDIEHNLASYVAVVTVINMTLGTIVAIGAWLFGLPNPVVLGIITAVLNYISYVGPACSATIVFAVGLVTFPTLGYALLPPACYVALNTLEGQIITPTILGRRLTLNPLAVLLAIAFWAWLWGPMGAFLAVPLLIVAMVIFGHLVPVGESKPPD